MTKFLRCAVFLVLIISTFLLFSCGGSADDSSNNPSDVPSQGSGDGGDNGNNGDNNNGTSTDDGSEEYLPAPFGVASFDDQ